MKTREKQLEKEIKSLKKCLKEAQKVKDAIGTALWYNGLNEIIIDWKSKEHIETLEPQRQIICDIGDDLEWDSALQLVYMICVLLFGDYGTSPRCGWIEDIEGFYKFIDELTKE